MVEANILDQILAPPESDLTPEIVASPATDPEPSQSDKTATPESDELETTGPVKLADLARQLDLKPDELFKAVNSDGHSAADAFASLKEHRDIDAERIELERSHNAMRVEKAQAHQVISDYVALLPAGAVDPALVEQLNKVTDQATEVRQAQVLQVIPEWKDPSAKQADVEDMVKMISQFGAMPADLGNIREAWVLNMTRHFTRLETRINAILAKAVKPKPKGVKRGPGKSDTPADSGKIDVTELVKSNR